MNQREIKNGGFDALDMENGDIAALLSSLPRVEAPDNFEFGVKAKIAKGSTPRRAIVPFLKVAAPLSLVFAIAGFGIFYGTSPSESGHQIAQVPGKVERPVVAERDETVPPAAPAAQTPFIDPPAAVQPARASIAPRRPDPVRPASNSRTLDRSGGGSLDSALGSANTILPKGLESASPRNANINANTGEIQVPVRTVFEMLGVAADLVDGGWKVRSVAENTVASRAKLQAGDVIEAIDGQQLKGNSLPRGTVTVVTVRRDGRSINVSLK